MTSKVLVEFLGTFFLILAALLASGPLAPVAVAAVLTAMIYAGGRISGAHYNPCVTVANWFRGVCPIAQTAAFLAAQFVAAGLAVAAASVIAGTRVVVAIRCDPAACVAAEFLFTFAMVYVILHVAAGRGTEGNQYFGVAIGLMVLGAAAIVGPISGAMLNPAVVVAKTLEGAIPSREAMWWVLPQFGAAIAGTTAFGRSDQGRR